MKKLKLSELDLGGAEVLTRKQLKKVLGGHSALGSGGCAGGTCNNTNEADKCASPCVCHNGTCVAAA